MDKFNLQNIIVEAEQFKPHVINTHKATRLVFETYDGAFIQIEESLELTVFL